MKYAYHATDKKKLRQIRGHGLTTGGAPSFGDRYSEYDDGQHLFFADDLEYLRGYYGDIMLRFPWPSDAKPDKNTFGRILPHQFVSKRPVSQSSIEVEESPHKWCSL